jgi:hypothetical protein
MLGIVLGIIVGLTIWAIMVIDVRITAGQLNRDKDGWTIFAILCPVVALLIIGLAMKPKRTDVSKVS